eukprot:3619844-Amphidinium_carterae.1
MLMWNNKPEVFHKLNRKLRVATWTWNSDVFDKPMWPDSNNCLGILNVKWKRLIRKPWISIDSQW